MWRGKFAFELPAPPTPQAIECWECAMSDSSGQPTRPHYAADTLAAMERRGSITASMRQAGEDFRALFTTAQLDPFNAGDISWPMTVHGSSRSFREERALCIERAREDVRRAILAVGGARVSRWLIPLARSWITELT